MFPSSAVCISVCVLLVCVLPLPPFFSRQQTESKGQGWLWIARCQCETCRMTNLPCEEIIIWLDQTAIFGIKAIPHFRAKALQFQYVQKQAVCYNHCHSHSFYSGVPNRFTVASFWCFGWPSLWRCLKCKNSYFFSQPYSFMCVFIYFYTLYFNYRSDLRFQI